MPLWLFWLVVAVVMIVVEATTTAFVTIYFGAAALVVAVLAAAGVPLALQLAAFGALAVGGLAATRPTLRRLAARGPALRTGAEALRGRPGVVTRAIGELEPGLVRIGGDTWTARSYFDEEAIPEGTRVEVVEVRGVTALVIPVGAPSAIAPPSPGKES